MRTVTVSSIVTNAASQLLPVAVSIEKQLTEGETPNPET